MNSIVAVFCLSVFLCLDVSAKGFPPSRGAPDCLDANKAPIVGNNNEQVLRWKEESPNQYHDRALVVGKLVDVLLDRQSHLHLEIDIGTAGKPRARNEHIEIVYNKSFGEVDQMAVGSLVQACGDYITANKQAGVYPPSPVGAIVHWVHASNNEGKHSNGFLMINGKLYGQSIPKDGGRRDFMSNILPMAAGF